MAVIGPQEGRGHLEAHGAAQARAVDGALWARLAHDPILESEYAAADHIRELPGELGASRPKLSLGNVEQSERSRNGVSPARTARR